MPLTDILQNAVTREASDVLVVAGLPVDYKINGRLCREGEKLFPAQTLALTQELYSLAGRDMTKLLDTGDKWIGITYKEDLEAARAEFRAMIDAGTYRERLWE